MRARRGAHKLERGLAFGGRTTLRRRAASSALTARTSTTVRFLESLEFRRNAIAVTTGIQLTFHAGVVGGGPCYGGKRGLLARSLTDGAAFEGDCCTAGGDDRDGVPCDSFGAPGGG